MTYTLCSGYLRFFSQVCYNLAKVRVLDNFSARWIVHDWKQHFISAKRSKYYQTIWKLGNVQFVKSEKKSDQRIWTWANRNSGKFWKNLSMIDIWMEAKSSLRSRIFSKSQSANLGFYCHHNIADNRVSF